MNRRRFLKAAGLAATGGLAGCLGGGSPQAAADPWLERSETAEGGTYSIEGRVRLSRGEFVPIPLETPGDGPVMMHVFGRTRLALPVDGLMFTAEQFSAYERGDEVEPLSAFSSYGGARLGVNNARLQSGNYVYVVDNTAFASRPMDEITLGLSLSLEG